MTFERSFLIYRDELLGASETFIPAQAESLNHFRPYYLGLRQIPGLPLPEDRFHFISRSGLAGKGTRVRFKLLGPSMALRRKLLDLSAVLVHAHFAPDACNALALARALQVPLVASFHGYDLTVHDDHQTSLYLRRRGSLKAQGSRFLCVSNFIRKQALAKGFPADKTVVHYTGIDVDFFQADAHITRSPVVLFVGRLVAKKGCEYLVRAMADIQRVAPETKLMIIGDGPLRGALQELAAATVKHFEFLGAQKPAVVREQMNRATVFCTPSVVSETGDAEGFGMVFAEAQAMGLPVVSFDCASLPEAVADGETGFLVPERDWQALGARILLFLRNTTLWSQFSGAGQSRVRCQFNIRKQAQALEVIYEQVIDEWRRAGKPVKSREGRFPSGVAHLCDKSLVTAVIPTHNRPDLVVRAVKTALNQTHPNMEVVVVVDGPDASTSKALSAIPDPRLHVVTLPISRGGSAARNTGVQAANGDWVAFLDDDDEWLPRKIELQLFAAQRSAHKIPVVLCRMIARTPLADYVWPRRLPEPGEPINEYLLCRKSIFHSRGVMQSSTLLTRRDFLLRVPFRDGLKKHQDWDWMLRVAGHDGVGFDFESGPLTIFNIDPTQPGISNRTDDWHYSFSWIEEMRPYISSRAYASFVLSDVADMAARVASPREYWALLKHSIHRGKPVLTDVLRYAIVRLFPPESRHRLRFWFGRTI